MTSSPQALPALTSIRGIAATLVIVFHYHLMVSKLATGEDGNILGKFYLMVDLFFVLSGFIMMHVYGAILGSALDKRSVLRFMQTRFARIYPLHIMSLTLMIILGWIYTDILGVTGGWMKDVVFDFSAIPSHLLLLNGMGTHYDATLNTPAWSISVEWWAYLLFPLIALGLNRQPRTTTIALILFVLCFYPAIMFYFQPAFWAERWAQIGMPDGTPFPMYTVDVITGSAFIRCLCGFFLGVLAYRFYSRGKIPSWLGGSYVTPAIALSIVIIWQFFWLPDPIAILGFALIILNLSQENRVSRLLSGRYFIVSGNLSYAIYMIHLPLIVSFSVIRKWLVPNDPLAEGVGYLFSPLTTYAGLIGFIVVTYILAALVTYYIDLPLRARLRSKI